MTLEDKIREKILDKNVIMNKSELDKQVNDALTKGTDFILGPKNNLTAYGTEELPDAIESDYIPYKKKLAMKEAEELAKSTSNESEEKESNN